MPTLKQSIAEKKAQESVLRKNPELDFKLDRFIQESTKLYEFFKGLSKEELIRKLMLGRMQRKEYAHARNEEIRAWVEEHPEIVSKIEERICNAPSTKREQMSLNATKAETLSQIVRASNIRS